MGGVLANVESGHLGVEVFELCPEPRGAPALLLECLVLGDSAAVLKAASLRGDCLAVTGSLLCQ